MMFDVRATVVPKIGGIHCKHIFFGQEWSRESSCVNISDILGTIDNFLFPSMVLLEEAHNAAFPFDREALKYLATSAGRKIYGEEFTAGNTWVKCFEKRWRHRLTKVKCGSIDRSRGAKATAEVRDAVFEKFTAFIQKLVDDGNMTEEQAANLGDRIANADEVGGDERGQSKRKVYKSRVRNAAWRSVDLGGDHNPFHVTLMLVSLSIGVLPNSVYVIHSSPS